MSLTILEGARVKPARKHIHSTHQRQPGDTLKLDELELPNVILVPDDAAHCELLTFGSMRETCPKCGTVHLKLVLRQDNVRRAHLFCPVCATCFDAHYLDGASALTI